MKTIDKIKQKLYADIFWKTRLGEVINCINDLTLHFRYQFKDDKLIDKINLESFLIKQYHIIEKGLSLPSPKPGFGISKIQTLLDKSECYLKSYGTSSLTESIASCLQEYIDFNHYCNFELDDALKRSIQEFIEKHDLKSSGGTKLVKKEVIEQLSKRPFNEFIVNRYSIRDFSDEIINEDLIIRSINLARHTPSVCNRQPWNAHYYDNKSVLDEVLKIQSGNSGFTDSIKGLIIVTGNLKAFTKHERNQLYIDGGMFAMNLINSLHYNSLGSCPLNTCLPFIDENKIKKISNIPKHERLIMMIAVGHLKEEFKVATSKRKSLNKIIQIHK